VAKWVPKVRSQQQGAVAAFLQEELKLLKRAVPALKFCRGDVPFNEDHWIALFHRLGMEKSVRLENLTAGHFLSRLDSVIKNERFCKELTARATGEIRIREAMVELKQWFAVTEFKLFEHNCLDRVTMLITDWKEMFTQLGDNQSLLASIKDSPFFKPFAGEASTYEQNLSDLDQYLHTLNQIQRKWLYLEPIFGRGALPQEQQRFKRIDEEFRDVLQKIETSPHVVNLCDDTLHSGLRNTVETCLEQLERCQKALSDFLESKRSKMPRFYFIGDDDLLEILGQAKNPDIIQNHLKKLFQGLHQVDFSKDKTKVVAMKSLKGEEVSLRAAVRLSDEVEVWLKALTNEMKDTLSSSLSKCLRSKTPDMNSFASQVLCLAEQIRFTRMCEDAVVNGTLSDLKRDLSKTLRRFTSLDLGNDRLKRLKVASLLMDLIHNIDVVSLLIKSRTQSLEDWEMNKQLRYYMNDRDKCVVRMVDAEFRYTYEYQGNRSKLVHTPLTDKCYLTLTQAMHQGYGGNPYGPAGTGKTESVKALGAALGRQVLVFNCSEGIDFNSMGRIFTGLVKGGAWGCFDEFNRLKEDQLSAVSQQIQLIVTAIKEKQNRMELLGKEIEVDHNAGIFVTLNPAGKGYGGRSKMPDNLKQLFRPVAMSRPDNDIIAEVLLFIEGFNDAKDLGRKMVSLFELSKQLLSQQQHYDWSLRAMKAVLVTGAKLIRRAKQEESDNGEISSEKEQEILIQAVRVNTLSKLTYVFCCFQTCLITKSLTYLLTHLLTHSLTHVHTFTNT